MKGHEGLVELVIVEENRRILFSLIIFANLITFTQVLQAIIALY